MISTETMTPPWTAEHSKAAQLEGWDVWQCDGSLYGPWQVQHIDDEEYVVSIGGKVLGSDDEAFLLVLNGTGPHHVAAVEFIKAHNPLDYELMLRVKQP